jgi:hypothetical protein
MKQILHIFLKDARRFWGEVVLLLAITFGFVSIGAYMGARPDNQQGQLLAVLASLLAMMIPVGWWLLITRVIQAERLVGDTQFWITRPYVWTSLMSAKGLFLLAFLYLPFFIAQCVLLAGAGFSPLGYVPGLLFNLLLFTGMLILPLAALATVTSTFARMTLTLLGISVLAIALISVSAFIFATHRATVGLSSRTAIPICFAIAVVDCLAAIVLQYARRRVWVARLILVALPLLLWGVMYCGWKYDQAQMDKVYAAVQGGAPIQLAYRPDAKNTETIGMPASSNAMIPVNVPLEETGVAAGKAVLPDAVRMEMTAPDGSRWESDWESGNGFKFLSGESMFKLGVSMPIEEFRKFEGKQVTVKLTVALTQTQAGRSSTIALPRERFAVAGFGVCTPQTGWTPEPGQISGLDCISPLNDPPLTFINTRWSDGSCTSAAGSGSGLVGETWLGELDRAPAAVNFSPLVELHVNLSNAVIEEGEGRGRFRTLCPGTPVTFTQYDRVRQMQVSVEIQGFTLPRVTETNGQLNVTE